MITLDPQWKPLDITLMKSYIMIIRAELGSCQRTEEAVEHEGDVDTNCSGNTWKVSQGAGKKIGGIGEQRKKRDYPDHMHC